MDIRAKMDYNNEYNRKTYKNITLRFNKQTEAEIIDFLAEKDITPYIRSLIREDMVRFEQSDDLAAPEVTAPHLVDDLPEHEDIEKYPYEILEQMPFFDKYVIAYCSDLDQCKEVVTKHCLKHESVGEIYICKRFKDSAGNIFGRRIRKEFIYK